MNEAQWGVEVNETAIYTHGAAAVWWGIYRAMVLERSGNTPRTLTPCAMGDVVFVAREDRTSAEWLCDLIHSKGTPKLAAKVVHLDASALGEEIRRLAQATTEETNDG